MTAFAKLFVLSSFKDWVVITFLIFGGCCSNAWALELVASQNPRAGSLITLAQFVLVSAVGIPKHLYFAGQKSKAKDVTGNRPFSIASLCFDPRLLFRVRVKPRSIPISRWMIQVVLFLLTSLLNNAAFAYRVPMAVHIIFRSAGLVTNLLLGWILVGKRYSFIQILSVVIVSLGVGMTTMSTRSRASAEAVGGGTDYIIGIAILTLALLLSSAMGLAQDQAYTKYGRGHWEEGMFYLHFLSLPMFIPLIPDLRNQIHVLNASDPIVFSSEAGIANFYLGPTTSSSFTLRIPTFYFPLLLNIGTQLVCVSGVHKLTAKVSSLTVTLVLVIRKAVSLMISVVVLGHSAGDRWLWGGAGAVLIGTILYTWEGTRSRKEKRD